MKTIIHTSTPNLEQSKDFYTKLGFTELQHDEDTLFSDSQFIVQINPERFARNGLKLYSDDWSDTTRKLSDIAEVLESKDEYVTSDPNGVWVYLSKDDPPTTIPDGPVGSTGIFAGISVEAVDIDRTVAFWTALGFEQSQGNLDQGWAVYTNGGEIGVSLMKANMCPHLFFNPGMTFFNSGENLKNIAKIRDAGIPITEEITHFNDKGIVDNVIINDPGGYGFFVFND